MNDRGILARFGEKLGKHSIGRVPSNTKTWEGFVSSNGEVFTRIFNLKQFCKDHNLNFIQMAKVGRREHSEHKGWTAYPPKPKGYSEPPHPEYSGNGFVSPEGIHYKSIGSISEFCTKFGLNPKRMSDVNTEKIQSHKGWTKYNPDKTFDPPKIFVARFIDQNGKIWETNNIAEFSKEHNLLRPQMSKLNTGKIGHYKGWRKYTPPA